MSNKINLLEFHNLINNKIQLCYKGPFDKHVLSAIGDHIKVIIRSDHRIFKKIFSIFIELAQNIAYYSAEVCKIDENETGVGSLVISEHADYYYFNVGNIIHNTDMELIIKKCKLINSFDRDELRDFKRKQRSLPQSGHGGANIGLIQVALTAGNPLDVQVDKINNEKSFITISVKIEK